MSNDYRRGMVRGLLYPALFVLGWKIEASTHAPAVRPQRALCNVELTAQVLASRAITAVELQR